MANESKHKWNFHRLGGLDQVVLQTADDFCRLRELDPKLWVALSCPTSGLEFDARTLALIDTDKDGRIRIPEILEAVEWTCARLKDPTGLKDSTNFLSIDDVRDDTDEGRHIIATIKAMLLNLDKGEAGDRAEAGGLTQEDVETSAASAAEHMFNGDGILPPLDSLEPDIRAYIEDVMKVMGAVQDAGGQFGVNLELSAAFMKLLREWRSWQDTVSGASSPLGKETAHAWEFLQEVKDKIDDYFLRAELAAYAPQAQASLNVDEKFIAPVENGVLSQQALSELPLSRVKPDKPLDLKFGLNPEWRDKIGRFAAAVKPLLKGEDRLDRENWLEIQKVFTPYAGALAKKPVRPEVEVAQAPTQAPTGSVEDLSPERIEELLDGDVSTRFDKLSEEDSNMPAAAADIAAVARLVLYHRHLYRLLMNFVSFFDFYSSDTRAAFQIGTLYIDGRSCELCLPVEDAAKHPVLAALSQLFLVYCNCTRKQAPGAAAPAETRTIVAAVTAGDVDLLMDNRHGVFVDVRGNDWDATVVKVSSNPISIRQAIWDPYRRFGRLISEQINKFASSKDADVTAMAGKHINDLTTAATAPAGQPAAPPKFDIGRNVGIFAAVGLALGAIGTALGSLAAALFSLSWWQFPLLFLGLFLLISGPSVLMACLKLRQRTLGPLLEASGWAVNGRVFINFFLGSQLTATAVLPPNSSRSYTDPFKKSRRWPWVVFALAVIAGAAGAGIWLWHKGYLKGLFE